MTNESNITNRNTWNPFLSTKRDIERTHELASKNPILAGFLTFLFIPAGLFYLNRGINCLKICGYIFVISFFFALITKPEKDSTNSLISLLGLGAITAEQVTAVNKAQQRQPEKSLLISAAELKKNNQETSSFEINQEAVKLLKQLKEKYEAHEISEEEFKIQKQRILNSL